MSRTALLRPEEASLRARVLSAKWPVAVMFMLSLVCAWQLAAALGGLPASVPSPGRVAIAVVELGGSGELARPVAQSLGRALAGLTLAVLVGAVLGLAAGVSRIVEDFVDPPVALTYAIPKVALFPPLAVWLGFSDQTRIIVIFLVCVYPVYLNAHHGARGIDPRLLWVGRNCGASRRRMITQIVLPASLPRTLVGIRIALALAFVMVFATEIIGFGTGVGSLIYRSYLDGRYDAMYAAIAVLGALGFAFDAAFGLLARRLTRGQTLRAIGVG